MNALVIFWKLAAPLMAWIVAFQCVAFELKNSAAAGAAVESTEENDDSMDLLFGSRFTYWIKDITPLIFVSAAESWDENTSSSWHPGGSVDWPLLSGKWIADPTPRQTLRINDPWLHFAVPLKIDTKPGTPGTPPASSR